MLRNSIRLRALTRLDRLQSDLARRSLRDLAPIDESQVPVEVRPLTAALIYDSMPYFHRAPP